MVTEPSSLGLSSAADDFRRARRQAAAQQVLARLTRRPTELLSFDDVRQKFKLGDSTDRGRQKIPLDAIVGSAGRYNDFTRSFLPRQDSDQERWARVKEAMTSSRSLPPIEVYQIDQAYFVLDGNHRVSVARQMGAGHIEAYVIHFDTKVSLNPDDDPNALIVKAEYAEFLERTCFDEIRPDANLQVTAPGQYWVLETHLEAHRYLFGQEEKRDVSFEEAAGHWYDQVYEPVVQGIRDQGLLRDFPDRTETDLYLWLYQHQATLRQKLGWQVELDAAAADLGREHSSKPHRVLTRVKQKLHRLLTPTPLEAGPAPGQWRHERLDGGRAERLFADILVPITGETGGWYALELALEVARYEDSQILGLHLVSTAAQKESPAAQVVKAEFEQRCQAAGISGKLAIDTGKVIGAICERARWADLIVMYPANPPGSKLVSRLTSGSRNVIYGSCRPVLTVPGPASRPERVVLAYDGSPKAREGLYVAAYLAGHWGVWLVVTTVVETEDDTDKLAQARHYLDSRGVTATYVPGQGDVAESILRTAEQQASDLIIIGGYGVRPFREAVLGSKVDQILAEAQRPVLVCR